MTANPYPISPIHHPHADGMRRRRSGRHTAWLAAVLLAASSGVALHSQTVPAAINYQGKLTDSNGNPVTKGAYEVWFRIWDDPTAAQTANYIWGRSFPLTVATNGMFNVLLTDDGTAVTAPGNPRVTTLLDAFEGTGRYLGLSVARTPTTQITSPVEISPRQQLVTSPYAIHAHQATKADSAASADNASKANEANHAASADSATKAAEANHAVNADNATKFSSLSTTDFLLLNKTDQTINGTVTVNNGNLTLKTTGSQANLSVAGNLTVDKTATLKAAVALSGGSSVTVAGAKPIRIRHYGPLSYTGTPMYYSPSDGPYASSTWSAAVIGFTCGGDFEENNSGDHLIDVIMEKDSSSNWRWRFAIRNDSMKNNIYVDIMWIRKELVDDTR